ncbi:MAG TPA: alpha/beta hydrolase-fold protein [Gallionellaceae bacterium]|nr:alpha/beta hydrolase-fold protein [Gallionellaceae bacterium]
MASDILPHITLDRGKSPQHSIIWLHGLGADGEDFVPVAEEMKLPVAMRYIFPHAPKQPVTINGGFIMRAWYDIASADIDAQQDEAGIRASQQEVERLIEQEKARGVAEENIFLAGFSQGGAIALHTGLRHPARLGGILALSTYLPLADTLNQEASTSAKHTPIFFAHGRSDPVVPYSLGKMSADKLRQLGYRVDWHDYGMPHSVCMEEIQDVERWLGQQLHV